LQKQVEPERNEPELKGLFQTMRAADAERAPSFARTVKAVPHHGRLGYLRVMVMAVVAVGILLVIGVNALRQGSAGESRPGTTTSKAAAEGGRATRPLVSAQSGGGTPPRQPAGRRRSNAATAAKKTSVPSAPSITKWKSPTDALLKFPGDELMSGVPKIGFTQGNGKTAE
jgi:hypothetical protein